MSNDLIITNTIANKIFTVRGHKVMLDRDLAELYGVAVKTLNQAVKRNIKRFPEDFMFQLNENEWNNLRSQFVTANPNLSKIRFLPYAFTEQGIAMLSSVLSSEQAIAVNIQIMRVFVKIKQFALENKELSEKLANVEHYLIQYAKENNAEIDKINQAINYLLDITKPSKVGFKTDI